MFEQKKLAEDYNFFANLFNSAEKDQDDELYKKQLYVLKDEIDDKIHQNSLKFKHDVLLSKLLLEDYNEFPPKTNNTQPSQQNNSSIIKANNINTNNDKDHNKEDDTDKIMNEENEFLRDLHRINYLTFSPFSLNFFDKFTGINNESIDKDSEDKLLKMLNFDYNNFEINNDLLFYIAQGFVDINKLKEENLKINQQQQPAPSSNGTESSKPTTTSEFKTKTENESEKINEANVKAFKNWMVKEIQNSPNREEIDEFLDELKQLSPSNKSEINLFFDKCKSTIVEIEEQKLKEKEEKRKQNEQEQKEMISQIKDTDNIKEDSEKKSLLNDDYDNFDLRSENEDQYAKMKKHNDKMKTSLSPQRVHLKSANKSKPKERMSYSSQNNVQQLQNQPQITNPSVIDTVTDISVKKGNETMKKNENKSTVKKKKKVDHLKCLNDKSNDRTSWMIKKSYNLIDNYGRDKKTKK